MNYGKVILILLGIFFFSTLNAQSTGIESATLVTPNASPEAVNLMRYINSISGKAILTGQHCVPLVGSNRLPEVFRNTKHYPALFGQDFGFSEPGTWDGINYRQHREHFE